MSDDFDPYHKWFGIPPEEQPPNHYRLLGLLMFENDEDAIDNAAEAKVLLLRSRQNGPLAKTCQRLLNEIAVARYCLLNQETRKRYNEQLRGHQHERTLPSSSAHANRPKIKELDRNAAEAPASRSDAPQPPPLPMVLWETAD